MSLTRIIWDEERNELRRAKPGESVEGVELFGASPGKRIDGVITPIGNPVLASMEVDPRHSDPRAEQPIPPRVMDIIRSYKELSCFRKANAYCISGCSAVYFDNLCPERGEVDAWAIQFYRLGK